MTGSKHIHVIDPQTIDAAMLRDALGEAYTVELFVDPASVVRAAEAGTVPNLIVIDVMAPTRRGFDFCRYLRTEPLLEGVPIIFSAARPSAADEELGLELGAVDFILKPYSASLVRARIENQLRLHDNARVLTETIARRTRQLVNTRLEIIRRLGRASEYKDDETGLHVVRMSHYCRIIAIDAGLSSAAAELLLEAAPMHDIGKIGIPDQILQKRGPLSEDEWKIMRKHPAIGAGIIGRHDDALLDTARICALAHHERWDGSGYPRGLAGELIPVPARIVAIADVFDALTSVRPYKPAWPLERATDYVREQAGKMFDPDLVQHFEHALPLILELRAKHQEAAHEPDKEALAKPPEEAPARAVAEAGSASS